ncbi:glycosyltransferase [Colwellia sp. E2M01]|uniref:glycosyltransferase n=1 Tax=Colwellia sp. E2M01 TaxID=2841561 RepID=UPI001C0844A2|nr:glycosyltransferase [Colwellia sp. E2M01]MBU2870033.1 glycosyltransferase [Colwellia sp. E2M01]
MSNFNDNSQKIHRIISLHPFDPRGCKVGGIETHVRHTIKFIPDNLDLVIVGVDESNELELGKVIELQNELGKTYKFLPILNTTKVHINKAAKSPLKSLTFNFFFALFKFGSTIKSLSKEMKSTIEIQRYEFSWFCRFYNLCHVLLTHGDADPNQKLDSLLSKMWFVHRFNEARALKAADCIISVSSEQAKRLQQDFPQRKEDIHYMTVSVDDSLFKATPYLIEDGILKIAFAGRLDEFKRPQMMFIIIKKLSEQLNGKVEFHYIGVSEPNRFAEYQAVKEHVICHGFQRSPNIAKLWQNFHMGIVTSVFEGWPVYVMEAICSGRPVSSLRLEQMASTFASGECGLMLDINNDQAVTVDLMVEGILSTWKKIQTAQINPVNVNQVINSFKASNQINKLFLLHQNIS